MQWKPLETASPLLNKKNQVSSEHFITEMHAEDLSGGDDEYIRWAGEYELMQRLQKKLQQLQEIEYGDPGLLQQEQGVG